MEKDTYQKLQWELQQLRRENLLAYKDSFLTRLNRYCRIKSITYLLNTFGKNVKIQKSNELLISSNNQPDLKITNFGGQGG